MKFITKLPLLLLLFITHQQIFAEQKTTEQEITGAEASKQMPGATRLMVKEGNGIPAFIAYEGSNKPTEQQFFNNLRKAYKLPANYGFALVTDENDQIGMEHKRYQLTVNNVPVSNGVILLHLRNGVVEIYNGTLFNAISAPQFPSLSEAHALQSALKNIGATTYKWQVPGEEEALKIGNPTATYQPVGKLELTQTKNDIKSNGFHLVWKFDVYAQEPMGRWYVYVDATTGGIIKKIDRICNANTAATATTVYRGARAVNTDSYNGAYRLRDVSRGSGVYTYNLKKGTSYAAAVDFTNATTTWNNVNTALDQYAGDAHWGGEMTYDFYQSMGRNSINNAGLLLKLYVHYSSNYVNAFWDGSQMNFGDGNTTYKPLTSLDITGHEVSHGLDQYTANLDYQDESGGLNESFSDIFGTAVEWFADSSRANWNIGEDIGTSFRSMATPKTYQQPDCYQGTYWYTGNQDNGGVHTNSGVQNKWYYLLAQGGTGTNDKGNAYTVVGLGRKKATQIAWRTMTNYLTNSSVYADARRLSIQAAVDLFGACSPEVASTTMAWYAVGVGAIYSAGAQASFTYSQGTSCQIPFNVTFTNTSSNGTNYTWYFGDGTTSTTASPTHTYTAFGIYTVKLVASGGTCGSDSIIKANIINVNASNACAVILPTTGSFTTQTSCNGTVYDDGGPTAVTGNNVNSTVTISPTGASQVKLHFNTFKMELNYDYLYVYDGPTIASTLLGRYTGYTLPADIVSTGPSVTIRETTDPALDSAGFSIDWTCIVSTSPPVANFKAATTQTCTGNVVFADLTTGGATSWLWNFGDGFTSTLQNPTHLYATNGTYTVTLTATNANGSNTKTSTNYIVVNRPSAPSVAAVQRCGSGTVSLNVNTTDSITWYDAAGNVTSTAHPFTTPVLTANTTYYAEEVVPQTTTYALGATSNTIGNGGYFVNPTPLHGLRFNVNEASTLVSVYVYAQNAGYRTVQYRDTLGNVIAYKQFNLPAGGSTLTLNFDLIPGGPYELGVKDTQNLYRNSSGASYPYTDAAGLVSIYGNTTMKAGAYDPGYYYYFYNWQVKKKDCVSLRAAVPVTINPAVTATITPTNIACYGAANGSIAAAASGGTPAFTYQWSNGTTASTATNLAPATYTVTVTDIKGCSATASTTIIQPASALSVTVSAINSNCSGSTGSATAIAAGGNIGYSYRWSNGQTTPTISGLPSGTYTVTVTDGRGCTTTANTTIASTSALVLGRSSTNVACYGAATGTATITPSGTAPYQYRWSNAATTATINGLSAGTYTVTVTDGGGCTATSNVTVTQPASALSLSLTPSNTGCGAVTGGMATTVTGGTSTYIYHWASGQTTSSLTNLSVGSYAVTVTDANSCTAAASASVINAGTLNLTPTYTNLKCDADTNGTASIAVSNGTAPFTYNWNTGAATAAITNLSAGTYLVTVSDGGGCSASTSITITQPTSLNVTLAPSNISCGSSAGSVTSNVTGGTSGYTYHWSSNQTTADLNNVSAGSYVLTVTDANGCTASRNTTISSTGVLQVNASINNVTCNSGANGSATITAGGTAPYIYNWSSGGNVSALNNLAAGTYTVTVTDANGCSGTTNVNITQPAALSVALTAHDATCGQTTGSVTSTINGGAGNYTFLWSNAATTSSLSAVNIGSYTLTVKDGNNCSATATAVVSSSSGLNLTSAAQQATCNGTTDGVAQVNVNGGNAPYRYNWSTGASTPTLTNVAAGVYTVTVTDAVSCSSSYAVTVTEPAALVVTETTTMPLCYGGATGAIHLNVTGGGSSAYTYAWSAGGSGTSASNLVAGNYTVTITDGNQCNTVDSVTLAQPAPLATNFNVVDVTCFGENDGSIGLKVVGGTPQYSYAWSTGGTDSVAQALVGGSYALTVTDANGCQKIDQVLVRQATSILVVSPSYVNTSAGQNIGKAVLTIHGGALPYQVLWSNTYTGDSISSLSAGTYGYTVTDNFGCVDTGSITISSGVGIDEMASGIKAEIFPNPTTGQVNVKLHLTSTDRVLIQLKDVLGRTLSVQELEAAKDISTVIDLAKQASGIYFIEVRSAGQNLVHKVILDK